APVPRARIVARKVPIASAISKPNPLPDRLTGSVSSIASAAAMRSVPRSVRMQDFEEFPRDVRRPRTEAEEAEAVHRNQPPGLSRRGQPYLVEAQDRLRPAGPFDCTVHHQDEVGSGGDRRLDGDRLISVDP